MQEKNWPVHSSPIDIIQNPHLKTLIKTRESENFAGSQQCYGGEHLENWVLGFISFHG